MVTRTKATPLQEIYAITVRSESGRQETYRTTEEHPFWTVEEGWRKAGLLSEAYTLIDRTGAPVQIIHVEKETELQDVYNIEVDEHHTYHVGEIGVWVHNADCCKVGAQQHQVYAVGSVNPRSGHTVLGVKYEPTNGNSDYIIEGTKPSTKGKLIQPQYYENPGHHDLNMGNASYNSTKQIIPDNHLDLWNNSVISNEDTNRWSRSVRNGEVVYDRFQNDGNGNFHWNGSTGVTYLPNGRPSANGRSIKIGDVPKDIKKLGGK